MLIDNLGAKNRSYKNSTPFPLTFKSEAKEPPRWSGRFFDVNLDLRIREDDRKREERWD